jgi:hypothetical protein
MFSDRPRVGDLLVARLGHESAAILIAKGGDEYQLHAPSNSIHEALDRARHIAATSSVDVWHRTSPTHFERIASYRRTS